MQVSLLNCYHYHQKSVAYKALDWAAQPLTKAFGGRSIDYIDGKKIPQTSRCGRITRLFLVIVFAPLAVLSAIALTCKALTWRCQKAKVTSAGTTLKTAQAEKKALQAAEKQTADDLDKVQNAYKAEDYEEAFNLLIEKPTLCKKIEPIHLVRMLVKVIPYGECDLDKLQKILPYVDDNIQKAYLIKGAIVCLIEKEIADERLSLEPGKIVSFVQGQFANDPYNYDYVICCEDVIIPGLMNINTFLSADYKNATTESASKNWIDFAKLEVIAGLRKALVATLPEGLQANKQEALQTNFEHWQKNCFHFKKGQNPTDLYSFNPMARKLNNELSAFVKNWNSNLVKLPDFLDQLEALAPAEKPLKEFLQRILAPLRKDNKSAFVKGIQAEKAKNKPEQSKLNFLLQCAMRDFMDLLVEELSKRKVLDPQDEPGQTPDTDTK